MAHSEPAMTQEVAPPEPVMTPALVLALPKDEPGKQPRRKSRKRSMPRKRGTSRKLTVSRAPLPTRQRRTGVRPRFLRQLAVAALLLVGLGLSVMLHDPRRATEAAVRPRAVAVADAPKEAAYRAPSVASVPVRTLWPRFSLSGLLSPGLRDGEGAAVVNGQVVSVGERIDGMTVKEIADEGVTLEFQGVRKFQGMEDGNKRSVNRPTKVQIGVSAFRKFAFMRNS